MNRYSATLSDVLSPKLESLVCECATQDISIQHQQSVDLLHNALWFVTVFSLCLIFYTVADVQCIIFSK